MIGEYRVINVLGKGGFGVVYAAVQPDIGKRVAIKVLRDEAAKVDDIVQRFKNEARAVNEINHPNIVDIFSFGTLPGSGTPYFVMEYLQGNSLAGLVGSGKRLSPAEVVELMGPVASAVDAAHAKGIVHRDLKPDNIFVDTSAGTTEVKVLDFGVAKFQTMNTQLTGKGETLGTWLYMAPEQCAGDEVDLHADVYSFGVIMFHALTGRFPIEGKHPMELLTKHLKHARQKPSVYGAPAELDDAIMPCLASEPTDRYSSLTAAYNAFAAASKRLGEDALVSTTATSRSPAPSVSETAFAATQASAQTEVDATGRTQVAESNAADAPVVPVSPPDRPGSKRGVYFAAAGAALVGVVSAGWLLMRDGDSKPNERHTRTSTILDAATKPTATVPSSKSAVDASVEPTNKANPPAPTPPSVVSKTPIRAPKKIKRAKASPLPEKLTWDNHRFQIQYGRLTADVRNCKNLDTSAKGTLKFWMAVSPSGRVSTFDVVKTPTAAIASCAERATKKLRFQRTKRGMARFAPRFKF